MRSRDRLQNQRENVIALLNEQSHALKLNLTLVFDGSQPKPAEAKRGHFDALEIVYTPEDQSADDYILKELENALNPNQEVVVTSDRELARRSILLGARTQSIEAFIAALVKKHQKAKKRVTASTFKTFQDTEANIKRLTLIFEQRLKDSPPSSD
jgi:predicted RNA-binding protein with PIN domain